MIDYRIALCVFLGGGVGSVLRYVVGVVAKGVCASAFPWHTMVINVVGSFALGLLGAMLPRLGVSPMVQMALTVGLCGGFTTFSTFAVEGLALLRSGNITMAIAYATLSLLLGIGAALLGLLCGR